MEYNAAIQKYWTKERVVEGLKEENEKLRFEEEDFGRRHDVKADTLKGENAALKARIRALESAKRALAKAKGLSLATAAPTEPLEALPPSSFRYSARGLFRSDIQGSWRQADRKEHFLEVIQPQLTDAVMPQIDKVAFRVNMPHGFKVTTIHPALATRFVEMVREEMSEYYPEEPGEIFVDETAIARNYASKEETIERDENEDDEEGGSEESGAEDEDEQGFSDLPMEEDDEEDDDFQGDSADDSDGGPRRRRSRSSSPEPRRTGVDGTRLSCVRLVRYDAKQTWLYRGKEKRFRKKMRSLLRSDTVEGRIVTRAKAFHAKLGESTSTIAPDEAKAFLKSVRAKMEELYLPKKVWMDLDALATMGGKRRRKDEDSEEEAESEAEMGSEVGGDGDGQGAESGIEEAGEDGFEH
jgi:hypothetical protein